MSKDHVTAKLLVASLNLRGGEMRWSERSPLLITQLIDLCPDVIAFQEVDLRIDQGNWICQRVNALLNRDEYAIYHIASPGTQVTGAALATMTRLRVRSHEGFDYLDGDWDHRIAQHVGVDVGGTILSFYNTHFIVTQGPSGEAQRLRQAEGLMEWIAARSRGPIVLVGDLNCLPIQPPVDTIKKRLNSVFEVAGIEQPGTFWSPLVPQPNPGQYAIDHIFASTDISVDDAGLAFHHSDPNDPTLCPSDHLGLSAALVIGRNPLRTES